MLERAALDAGEYGAVHYLAHLLDDAFRRFLAPGVVKILADEDHASPRSAEGLMGGGGYDVGVLERVVEQAGGYEPCGVRHVDHEHSAHHVGYLAHAFVVPLAAVGRCAPYYQLGPVFLCLRLHLVIVYPPGILLYLV